MSETHTIIDSSETMSNIKKKTIDELLIDFPIMNRFYLSLMGIGGIAFMSESFEIQCLNNFKVSS